MRLSPVAHTILTPSFILAGDRPSQCEHCQWILAVCHKLMRCPHLPTIRDDIFGNEDVMESFWFHSQLIIKLLGESDFYQKINFPFLTWKVFYCWFYWWYNVCDCFTVLCFLAYISVLYFTWCNYEFLIGCMTPNSPCLLFALGDH